MSVRKPLEINRQVSTDAIESSVTLTTADLQKKSILRKINRQFYRLLMRENRRILHELVWCLSLQVNTKCWSHADCSPKECCAGISDKRAGICRHQPQPKEPCDPFLWVGALWQLAVSICLYQDKMSGGAMWFQRFALVEFIFQSSKKYYFTFFKKSLSSIKRSSLGNTILNFLSPHWLLNSTFMWCCLFCDTAWF